MAALLLAVLAPKTAAAEVPYALHFEGTETLALDIPLGIAGLAVLIWLDPPKDCSWCEPGGGDLAISRALDGEDAIATIGTLSDVGLYLAVLGSPVLAFGAGLAEHDTSGGLRGLENALVVSESMLVAWLITRLVKVLVARQRPDAYLGRRDAGGEHRSFFSGHTAGSAAALASLATVAAIRGYPWATAAAFAGGGLAFATGLFRVIALRHWATDVFVGWLVGAAAGVLLPLALHGRQARPAQADSGALSLPLLRIGF